MRGVSVWKGAGIVLAVAVVGALVHGGPARGTIPSATGVLHGCYRAKRGTLRIVDEGASCRKKELGVQWTDGGNVLAARVDGDGTLLGGRGAVSATWTTVVYRVVFDRDVSACAYSVTPQPPPGWGYNDHLSMLAQSDAGNAQQVVVFASNEAGSNVVVAFHLVVVCP
jgi:hypothetical protein